MEEEMKSYIHGRKDFMNDAIQEMHANIHNFDEKARIIEILLRVDE